MLATLEAIGLADAICEAAHYKEKVIENKANRVLIWT